MSSCAFCDDRTDHDQQPCKDRYIAEIYDPWCCDSTEAARILRCSTQRVSQFREEGLLKTQRKGRKWMFKRHDLRKLYTQIRYYAEFGSEFPLDPPELNQLLDRILIIRLQEKWGTP